MSRTDEDGGRAESATGPGAGIGAGRGAGGGAAAPTLPRSRRLIGVDAARGLALLGMMAAHLVPRLGASGEETWGFALVDGRSSATFALLAGVGLALADGGRAGARTPFGRMVARTSVRALVILVIGLLLASLGPPVAIILQYYALSFLLLAPLLRLPAPVLGLGGLVWLGLAPFASHALRAAGALEGPGAQVGTVQVLTAPLDALVTLLLTGYYPVLSWFGYLLVGAAVGRLAITRTPVAAALAATGAVLMVAATLGSGVLSSDADARAALADSVATTGRAVTGPFYGTTPTTSWWWLALDVPHSGAPPDLLGTTGAALLVLGGCLLLSRTPVVWLLRPIAAAGSMTLTLYTVHVLAVLAELPGLGAGADWVFHAVTALAVATLVRAFLTRGPLEAFVAAVVDGAAGPATPRAPRVPAGAASPTSPTTLARDRDPEP